MKAPNDLLVSVTETFLREYNAGYDELVRNRIVAHSVNERSKTLERRVEELKVENDLLSGCLREAKDANSNTETLYKESCKARHDTAYHYFEKANELRRSEAELIKVKDELAASQRLLEAASRKITSLKAAMPTSRKHR